jgi:hypothetical protein
MAMKKIIVKSMACLTMENYKKKRDDLIAQSEKHADSTWNKWINKCEIKEIVIQGGDK